MNKIALLANYIKDSRRAVFLGGAGMSTESGIPDFRSADGLYQGNNTITPETILSHDFFFEHTADFFTFYQKKMIYPKARPNPGHKALARWEKSGWLRAVITQNIDGLHQKAGSNKVFE